MSGWKALSMRACRATVSRDMEGMGKWGNGGMSNDTRHPERAQRVEGSALWFLTLVSHRERRERRARRSDLSGGPSHHLVSWVERSAAPVRASRRRKQFCVLCALREKKEPRRL